MRLKTWDKMMLERRVMRTRCRCNMIRKLMSLTWKRITLIKNKRNNKSNPVPK